MKIRFKLTETIPEHIEEGMLYVSFAYWTTAHKCCCGCGQKVVLRLSPRHWAITLNGESVSMYPSVGNWQLPCRSHYWIEDGHVLPAERWSEAMIKRNRVRTKGRRTPLQTPRSRLHGSSELEGGSEISVGKYIPCQENDAEGNHGDAVGGELALAGEDRDITPAVSIRWWSGTGNSVLQMWRKLIRSS